MEGQTLYFMDGQSECILKRKLHAIVDDVIDGETTGDLADTDFLSE